METVQLKDKTPVFHRTRFLDKSYPTGYSSYSIMSHLLHIFLVISVSLIPHKPYSYLSQPLVVSKEKRLGLDSRKR